MASPQSTLRKLIRARGLTYRQVADALGVTPVAVNDWLHKKRTPSPPYRAALESYFGIDAKSGEPSLAASRWETAAERAVAVRAAAFTARPAA